MATFITSRELAANPSEVFAAVSDAERLARWWGPAGFTNTFDVCDFRPGGAWRFTMHGPDGAAYRNESVFAEIEANRKIVIEHVSAPRFTLAVELEVAEAGTLVSWTQTFEDPAVAAAIRHIVEPANEQNLDRLAAEVGAA
ncbi:MAG TPA: SRPBCC family protein [Thermoanaerobaculia bacterium]|nr:SRPBCC family protein [Thermoanaerobaculia bacterium]